MALIDEIYFALEGKEGMSYEELSKETNNDYKSIAQAILRELSNDNKAPFLEQTTDYPKKVRLSDFGLIHIKKRREEEQKRREEAQKIQKNIDAEKSEEQKRIEFEKLLFLKVGSFFMSNQASITPNVAALDMMKFNEFFNEGFDFALNYPEKFLKLAEEGLTLVDLPIVLNGKLINAKPRIRLTNIPQIDCRTLAEVRYAKNIKKLLSFDAIVVVASMINQRETISTFICPSCDERIMILQENEELEMPHICSCGNRRGFKHAEGKYVDEQIIVLQEATHSSAPVQIKAVLRCDLCDSFETEKRKFLAGNRVRFIGIPNLEHTFKYGKQSSTATPYLSVHNYEVIDNKLLELKPEDIEEIKAFSKKEDCIKLFNMMIAPHINGYDVVKEAIALQLFGGVKTETSRGNIHILLDGDPSSGKTQILKHVINKLAIKGEFSTCSSASHIGLTAAVRMDKTLGNYVVEAGALVLSNGGLLAIDELDKIPREDEGHLNNALEDGSFRVDKANIHVTLPSDCAVLAAANPRTETETFSESKNDSSQIKFSKTLLSRFDLVFIFKDIANKERDGKIADSVLRDSVRLSYPLDLMFFKKYCYFAHRINPVISDTGFEMLKKQYLTLREIPTEERITPRDLSALRRLAQASARMRLSETVENFDIEKAIRIYGESMRAKRSVAKIKDFLEWMGVTEKSRVDAEEKFGMDVIEKCLHDGLIFSPNSGILKKL